MADLLTETGMGLYGAVLNIWYETVRVIPGLLGALVIILVGIIIGRIAKELIVRILQHAKVDKWIEDHKLKAAIGNLHVSVITGSFVKWYIIALFLAQAVDLINMRVLKTFTEMLVYYIPLVLGGLVIFIGGLLVARFVRNVIETTQHQFKKTAAVIAEIILVYMAAVMALTTIGFDVTILVDAFKIAFTALVLSLSIVLGIAFGLAFFKDAKQIVIDLKKEIEK